MKIRSAAAVVISIVTFAACASKKSEDSAPYTAELPATQSQLEPWEQNNFKDSVSKIEFETPRFLVRDDLIDFTNLLAVDAVEHEDEGLRYEIVTPAKEIKMLTIYKDALGETNGILVEFEVEGRGFGHWSGVQSFMHACVGYLVKNPESGKYEKPSSFAECAVMEDYRE